MGEELQFIKTFRFKSLGQDLHLCNPRQISPMGWSKLCQRRWIQGIGFFFLFLQLAKLLNRASEPVLTAPGWVTHCRTRWYRQRAPTSHMGLVGLGGGSQSFTDRTCSTQRDSAFDRVHLCLFFYFQNALRKKREQHTDAQINVISSAS